MVKHVSVEDIRQSVERGEPFRLVDVRSPGEFRRVHARGAISVPLETVSAARVAELPGEGPIYIICQTGGRSKRACEGLGELGNDVASVDGGTEAWERAGLPVERSESGAISIERQVRIVAGTLVFASVLLGYFVHPGFLAVAGFVGAGLAFAGVTNTCGMGMLLLKMPWNRA